MLLVYTFFFNLLVSQFCGVQAALANDVTGWLCPATTRPAASDQTRSWLSAPVEATSVPASPKPVVQTKLGAAVCSA